MDTSWEKRARGIATVSLVLQFRQNLHCQKQADLCEMAFTAEKNNKDKQEHLAVSIQSPPAESRRTIKKQPLFSVIKFCELESLSSLSYKFYDWSGDLGAEDPFFNPC